MNASAIVLAAGAGTRMKSKKPKLAHEMLGKPLVRWVVDTLKSAGIDHVVSVVGHGREQVIPLVEKDTSIVVQNQLRGTADAVNSCRANFENYEGSLLVISGDSPLISPETIKALIAKKEKEQAAAVVLSMKLDDPFGYGRIVRTTSGTLERIVEQKDCDGSQAALTECNSGIYCFDAQALFDALAQVNNQNAQGEFYLTDVLEISRKTGRRVFAMQTPHPEECIGINSRSQLAQASALAQKRINEHFMDQGVTMTDPSLVWIGPDVQIDSDVEILPMTSLFGRTSVGEDCIIGPNTRLLDTTVGKACRLDETIAQNAQIADEVECGPRAYLRPGADIRKGAKVGTSVEVKKSIVGQNSKVPHLSYIGDAEIGEDVNIGAGSITCNYDGQKKHKTIIDNNVFVGSDTMLVAPVHIGSGATIGAGSVITEDVSDRALGLGRARQVEIPDWAK